jgi:hypothetical protein
MMKNHEIVRALPKLKTLRLDLETLKDQIMRLQKQSLQLQGEVGVLGEVTDVIDGIAVRVDTEPNIYGKVYKIAAVGSDIERQADVYPNANTSVGGVAKDWGLKLYGPRKAFGGFEEQWLMTGWAYRDAVEVAQRWMARGEVPTEQQKQLALARHRLDPEGRATKRRREAFEAAWLADHKQLAEEILLGWVRPSKALPKKAKAHA